jgi:pimeloyl-ACP methyl ester carboxylesterase
MKIISLLPGWIFGVIFFLLFLLGLAARHYLASLCLLPGIVLLVPPLRLWVGGLVGMRIRWWLLVLLLPLLFFLFIFLVFKDMANPRSIYRDPRVEAKLMAIYDARMKQWPVPYEGRDLATRFGKVHVIVSGPDGAPPVFLLHASSMASWSWLYNIEDLTRHFRIFAVDTIGDAGRSSLADINRFPQNGEELARLYREIMDRLGVSRAGFIGASQGGFIATNIALHAPERVNKVVLCGPMGYAGTLGSVLRILGTTMFPVRPIQESAIRWAFGADPRVKEFVGEWFRLIMAGVVPRQARPRAFSDEELQGLKMPVLMLLGQRDGLVGDAEAAGRRISRFANFRAAMLDTGHLISAEKPERFNQIVTDFLAD